MTTRSEIANTARSYLGVPWRHMGTTRTGVDCVGLLIAVARELKFISPDWKVPPYSRQPDGTMLAVFEANMQRIPLQKIQNGSAVVFEYYGSPHHAGIVVDLEREAFVHAFAAQKSVVLDILSHSQRGRVLVKAYDFKGVQNG